MIYLNNGDNTITVTLYEKSTQVQPYYTCKLQRKGTFDEVIFYQDDHSYAPYYWNSFTVSVGTYSGGLTAGQIDINYGEWQYTYYEMPGPYDIDLSNALGIVETGICIVGATYTPNETYSGTDNSEIKYYKNI